MSPSEVALTEPGTILIMSPHEGSSWTEPATVSAFAQSSPNSVLIQFATTELARSPTRRLLDLGCGAARNALPLARSGWDVLGIDLSWSMLLAAAVRVREAGRVARVQLAQAPMECIPAMDQCFDFVVAHGIWNLAPSGTVFRRAVADAARVAKPGAALFVFTFSRNTLPPEATPLPGDPFVFTQFSGQPQCFLTQAELVAELDAAGFVPEPGVPIREHNSRQLRSLVSASGPAIHEGIFRKRA